MKYFTFATSIAQGRGLKYYLLAAPILFALYSYAAAANINSEHLINYAIICGGLGLACSAITFIDMEDIKLGTLVIFLINGVANLVTFNCATIFLATIPIAIYIYYFSLTESVRAFVLTYGLYAVLLNIPNISPSINLGTAYQFLSMFMGIAFFITIYTKYKNRLQRTNRAVNYHRIERLQLYMLCSALIFSSNILSFVWDDLNGYLWIPIRSVEQNFTAVDVKLPATLTQYSLHNLSYTTFLFWIFGDNTVLDKIRVWKFFNATCYIGLICSMATTIVRRKWLLSSFIILLIPQYLMSEIIGNQNDFPLVAASTFVLFLILTQQIRNQDFFLFSLLIAASPKAAIPIFSYVLYNLIFNYQRFRSKLDSVTVVFWGAVGVMMLSPVYIRNYILTGNWKFPAGNNILKSPLFYDTGLVSDKFRLSHGPTFDSYVDVLFNSAKGTEIFFSSNIRIFGPTLIISLLCWISVKLLQKNKAGDIQSTPPVIEMASLSVISYFLTDATVGLQHRYAYASIFFMLAFILFSFKSNLPIIKGGLFCVVCSLITLSFASPWTQGTFRYDNAWIKATGDKWTDRIHFYEKANAIISKDDGVLIYYIQDKVFLNNRYVYELDWYDFWLSKLLHDNLDGKKDKNFGRTEFKFILCNHHVQWLILSRDHDPFELKIREYFPSVLKGLDVDLINLECNKKEIL